MLSRRLILSPRMRSRAACRVASFWLMQWLLIRSDGVVVSGGHGQGQFTLDVVQALDLVTEDAFQGSLQGGEFLAHAMAPDQIGWRGSQRRTRSGSVHP